MYEKIKRWYILGLWTKTQVDIALKKGVITQEQHDEIVQAI